MPRAQPDPMPPPTPGGRHVLYGAPGSGSAAVEVALNRCGLACEQVRAATWEPASALDELRRINPLQQVPTLVLPDGSVMSESAAILIHLGLAHPGSGLLPTDAVARARVLRGLVYIAANCYAAIGICDYPGRWTSATTKPAHERLRRGARQRLHQQWDLFADTFAPGDGGFLSDDGGQPGALDILAAVVSKWSGARAHLAQSRPALLACLQRIEGHASVAPVFARHWPAKPGA